VDDYYGRGKDERGEPPTWQDVNFASRYVVIYARKKKGVNIGTCFNLA
jgi:hypothetical protein